MASCEICGVEVVASMCCWIHSRHICLNCFASYHPIPIIEVGDPCNLDWSTLPLFSIDSILNELKVIEADLR